MEDATKFEELIEQGEPGINDLLAAYGIIEERYGEAASALVAPEIVTTSNTSAA